jgi:hypothetical protein
MSDLKPIAIVRFPIHCIGTTHTEVLLPVQVGISAELPSGSYSDKNLDYYTFFDFLLNKGQSYETVPKDRFNNKR